jgi:hypothetical protein
MAQVTPLPPLDTFKGFDTAGKEQGRTSINLIFKDFQTFREPVFY